LYGFLAQNFQELTSYLTIEQNIANRSAELAQRNPYANANISTQDRQLSAAIEEDSRKLEIFKKVFNERIKENINVNDDKAWAFGHWYYHNKDRSDYADDLYKTIADNDSD
jgi:hypothetical protein